MARGQCQHTFQRGVGLGPRASGQRVDDRNIPGHGDAPPEEMDVVAFGNTIGLLGIQAGFRRSATFGRGLVEWEQPVRHPLELGLHDDGIACIESIQVLEDCAGTIAVPGEREVSGFAGHLRVRVVAGAGPQVLVACALDDCVRGAECGEMHARESLAEHRDQRGHRLIIDRS